MRSLRDLLGRGDPMSVGVEEKEEDYTESHEVHVDAEDDTGVIEAPASLRAADGVNGAGDCGQGGDGQQHGGVIVREVGERQGNAEAEEYKNASSENGGNARIEERTSHAATNRLEGFVPGCVAPQSHGRARVANGDDDSTDVWLISSDGENLD
jgi:hypothetical protein